MPNSKWANTQQRILDAATGMFSISGYNGVSMRDIAAVAKVNETSIYRYYPGKRELFIAALDTELSKVRLDTDQIAKLVAMPDEHAARVALFRIIIQKVSHHRALIRLLQFSVLEDSDDLNDICRRHVRQIHQTAREFLRDSPECGKTQRFEARLTIFVLIAVFIALKDFYPKLFGNRLSTESLEDAASTCADLWHVALAERTEDSVPSAPPGHD